MAEVELDGGIIGEIGLPTLGDGDGRKAEEIVLALKRQVKRSVGAQRLDLFVLPGAQQPLPPAVGQNFQQSRALRSAELPVDSQGLDLYLSHGAILLVKELR